jgi:hypothetical protein
VDGDKVLIECAMGARWGFYKFPPDPKDADPVGEGRLAWREVQARVSLPEEDPVCTVASGSHALVCFDLTLPLPDQLESAKRRLQMAQRERIRSGQILAPRIAAHHEHLCRKLRLLDALEAGVEEWEIIQRLFAGMDASFHADSVAAIALRERDYRHLLLFE